MSTTAIIVLVILMGLIMGGMIGAIILLNKNEQKKRAFQIITGQSVSDAAHDENGNPNKRRANMSKRLQKEKDGAVKKISTLESMLRQAGWGNVSVGKFWLISLGVGLGLMLFTKITGQATPIVFMSGVIGIFGLPRFVLKFKMNKRQKKFLEEFPDALESMVRLLKAGMPVGEAIAMVSREYTGPVGEEMSKVYDEQKIGISMAEACLHAAERMPITEMQMFATGIAIQQQTGSSLSEILINLAKVIRARFRLKRKVQALSAEAKASAMIIGSLPILVGAGMTLINPDYMYPLYNTLKGKFLLYAAIGWMGCGIVIMKQMINFRI
jgi:tight adherence protein B